VAIGNQPCPAAAKATDADRLELGFELFEADPLGVDRVSQRAAGYAPCIGTHDLPEEAVIGVATAVVAYGGA
jgi:hypothetical protein